MDQPTKTATQTARQAAFAWYRPLGEFDPWFLWLTADPEPDLP